MNYVEISDCKERLFQIAIDFDPRQKTPPYELNTAGVAKLDGILKSSQASWYVGVLEKAAYLFASINKGHCFDSGNKRISLLVTADFIYRNGFRKHKPVTKKAFSNWFRNNFPNYELEERKFKTTFGWAFYNLSKAVAADENRNFDSLKQKIENFLKLTFKSMN